MLMKYVALHIDLQLRSAELETSCLDSPCTVVWRDGLTRRGVTPLYWACTTGQEDSAMLLIKAGADVNALNTRSDEEQLSSLYRAAKMGQEQVVRALLARGADPNLGDGCPLSYAKTPKIRNIIELWESPASYMR